MRVKKSSLFGWVFTIILFVLITVLFLNREWFYDYYRGMSYKPSSEMARIRDDLLLTGQGEFWFNAAQPVLSDADEFNAHCRPVGNTEVAVLGCYTEGNIYVYDIDSEELEGIRELTAAHELLHVRWAKMSEGEKDKLRPYLDQVLENHRDVLGDEIDIYDESEKIEELYVRAGTEVDDLPFELEEHFAEVFSDQDKIVRFYNSYIGVFRRLEAEMDSLKTEMEQIEADINAKTDEYRVRFSTLNAEIEDFNDCAKTEGCFATEWEFTLRRNQLIAEQNNLQGLYNEIDGLIDTYNEKVEAYNADVVRTDELNQMVNSTSRPTEIGQ